MSNEIRIIEGIKEVQGILSIDRMPTSKELRQSGMSWLDTLIGCNGGLKHWAEKLELETKHIGTNSTVESVIKRLKLLISELKMDRMPVTSEVQNSSYGNSLHNDIVRLGGYRYFAEIMNLPIKHSETSLGQDFEYKVIDLLREMNYNVIKMDTLHPFDILINDTVKIDVKVANARVDDKGNVSHTFGINKRIASCDIYIIVCLNEDKSIERLMVIPSHHLKIVTLCIGKNSKYNKYIDRFDYIDSYSEFFNSI